MDSGREQNKRIHDLPARRPPEEGGDDGGGDEEKQEKGLIASKRALRNHQTTEELPMCVISSGSIEYPSIT